MNTDKAKAEGMKNREDFLLALAGRTPGWPSGIANSLGERTLACQTPKVHGCVDNITSPLLYPCSLALISGKSALASQIHPLARADGVESRVPPARQGSPA